MWRKTPSGGEKGLAHFTNPPILDLDTRQGVFVSPQARLLEKSSSMDSTNTTLRPHLNVVDLSRILRIKQESVQALILGGRLKAYRANPSARRNSFRVTHEALEEFQRANQVIAASN